MDWTKLPSLIQTFSPGEGATWNPIISLRADRVFPPLVYAKVPDKNLLVLGKDFSKKEVAPIFGLAGQGVFLKRAKMLISR
jgi:hypothetical protein